jgi:hypothetical protein
MRIAIIVSQDVVHDHAGQTAYLQLLFSTIICLDSAYSFSQSPREIKEKGIRKKVISFLSKLTKHLVHLVNPPDANFLQKKTVYCLNIMR